nr:LOW QUALITY PROTEIN: bromodomain adjacent to zinc finger domain protein 2B-like [Dermatophagoides farinae]
MAYGDPQPHPTQTHHQPLLQQQQTPPTLPLPDFSGFGNLLAAFNQQQAHLQQQQQQQQQQPRKRGRPPTLSPPHNAHQNSLANSKLATNQQATSAFHQNTYPFNLFNTPAANDGIIPNFPGLNALSLAAAAALAGGGQLANHQLFNNAVNQFSILQKLNPNLLNANLFANLKNPMELAAAAAAVTANSNDIVNNKHSSASSSSSSSSSKFVDPALLLQKELNDQMQANFLSSLPAAVAKNLIGDQSGGSNTSMNKSSFAHKSNSSDKQLRISLNHGFQRFTYITGFSKSGTIEGDVIYIAPCKKKIKSYQDLIKYLSKNNVVNLSRENFSFDPNVIIGQFIPNIAQLPSDVILSENQMKVHLEELSKIRNLDLSATSITAVPPQQTIAQSNQNYSSSNHIIPEKKKRVRDSGGTRNVYDSIKGFNTRSKTAAVVHHQNNDIKNNELEPSVTITIQNPMVTPAPIRGTKRKSTERHETARNEKLLKKQQEELERKQRELKEKEEEELRKIKENQEKLLELQKQEQLKISAEIEHERVSQHQMFIHALNELKSSEDRDSKKEELSSEKVALQERKLLKRVLEVELLKELKKPVEDMMLKDHKNLPIFNRIPGQKLTGKAFADLLMVYEFLYNFGETIGFDVDSLPTLNSLMMALLNLDSEAEEELMSIVNHLVICAIEDPGMPNNMTTLMGQKLKDATVTEHNVTEILRLYFLAFSNAVREEDEPNRVECKIHERLCSGISFIALDAIVKLDILVFLCNELLCNQAIVKQIDDSIESVTVFKKDKWGIENDIRKFRLVKMRRERIIEEEKAKQLLLQQEKDNANTNQSATTMAENGGENNVTNTGENTTGTGENSTVISDNDESNTNVSAATLSNSVTTINLPPIEFDDDVNMTNEEIDKKIERLNKQCNQMNNKMHKALNAYRVFPLGQDRYRRTYWVLPNCGGVFVEGMESGEPEELANNVWTEEEIEMENALKNAINDEPMEDLTTGDGEIKSELDKQSMNGDNDVEQTDTMSIKEENDDRDNAYKDVPSTDDEKKPIVDGQQVKPEMEPKMEKDDALKTESNENEMTTTNQMDKKDELSESEQIDVNNAQQIDHITVDDVRWFDLDLDFECDQSVEQPPIIDESTTVKEKDDEETAEEKETNEQEKDDQNQENKKEEEDDDEEEEEIAEIKEEPMSEMDRALTTFMSQDTLDCLFKRTEMNIDCAILKDCLLRILSSFARSATITKFPNSEVIETDIIVCPTLQKRIQLWKVLQYETPRKVPREYQFGWWRITDGAQLKSMIELLHSNALREKNLQKHLIKHLNYATISCRNSIANLDVSDYDRDASDWREFGAPTENRCPHRSCMGKNYCHEVALRKDLQVLELIEAFEEKILSCSMQIRNWKPSNKLSSADFKSKLNQNKSSKTNKNGKNRKNHKNNNNHNENSDCSNDSIQENGTNGCTLVISTENNGDYDLLRVQKEKLLEIEATIERRYLKPPLGFKNNQALQFTTDNGNGGDDYNEYANDDNATAGLIRWRDAAREAKCCSQIAMGLHFLENCIAWDKSIMRANTIDKVCIVCGKKGKLLNCDTCAKAFHPNCIDPPVNKQIKGRWICHMCMRKNKRNSSSKSSKKSSSKESSSANDDRNHDSNIMGNNSNTRESSSKRMSNGNAKDKGEKETANKKERKPKKKQDKEKDNKDNKDKDEDHHLEKEKSEKNEKMSNKKSMEKECSNNSNANNNGNNMAGTMEQQQQQSLATNSSSIKNDEIALCKQITDEIMKHETSWPFLEPVNTKHFPTYRKIIKKPMDFTLIKNKLQNNSYKTKEDYAADIRLMFDNCVTFNEDESPVGQAGHLLRAFFESRWKELFNTPI